MSDRRARSLTTLLDVSPYSRSNRFRLSRLRLLEVLISAVLETQQRCTVLDVGGTEGFWRVWENEINWNHTQITCVNLDAYTRAEHDRQTRVRLIHGDACNLLGIEDYEYDVAFSNSVIEHVGSWQNMRAMAREVKRVAPRYLVQTPNFWFPVEPHARLPILHWLPEPIAYRVVMMRKCGFWERQDSVSGAVETVQSAKLIDMRQMRALFEGATILRERFFGMTKSLIAIKGLPPHSEFSMP